MLEVSIPCWRNMYQNSKIFKKINKKYTHTRTPQPPLAQCSFDGCTHRKLVPAVELDVKCVTDIILPVRIKDTDVYISFKSCRLLSQNLIREVNTRSLW